MCDGDEFEEVQCIPTLMNGELDRDAMCYCVNTTTGDRLSRSTDSRDQIDCDSEYNNMNVLFSLRLYVCGHKRSV